MNEPSQNTRPRLVRIALAQVDCALGDLEQNLARTREVLERARAEGADIVVFPELSLSGYSVGRVSEDISLEAVDDQIAQRVGDDAELGVVVGFVEAGRLHTYNSAAYIDGGVLIHVHRKLYLPTYGVYDERKHFSPGQAMRAFDTDFGPMAVLICNDVWQPAIPWLAVHSGAEVLVVPVNSATTDVGVPTDRAWEILLLHAAVVLQSYVIFVNRSGQENQRDFWGGSRVIHPSGEVLGSLGHEPGELDCVIDLDELRVLRRRRPLLQESRADLIAKATSQLADEES